MKNPMGGTPPITRLDNRRRYAAAERALFENNIAEHAAGIIDETPEWCRLYDEMRAAMQGVPWWRRALIERRILRELDYWNRTGQR